MPLHFVLDNDNQKNSISIEFVKRLELPTTPHTQPYNIGWLIQGQGIYITQQCHLQHDINPFKYEALCDMAPLQVCYVLLGQPYMWNRHVIYESRPLSVIYHFGGTTLLDTRDSYTYHSLAG